MNEKQKRKYVLEYMADEDLVSDEAIDLILKLINKGQHINKTELLEMSGYDIEQTFDTAYPEPYANKIRELYPNFDNGWYFYDYSKQTFGEMVNVYDLFAERIIRLFSK